MDYFKLKPILFSALVFCLFIIGCKGKTNDADLQSAVSDKLKENTSVANVTATVNEGVVTLTGQCADDNCKSSAEAAAKSVSGVKGVVNNITVASDMQAPVTISPDNTLRDSVNETLKSYSGVTATVNDGVVTLNGTIKKDDLQPLMMKLNSFRPQKIENKLVVK